MLNIELILVKFPSKLKKLPWMGKHRYSNAHCLTSFMELFSVRLMLNVAYIHRL